MASNPQRPHSLPGRVFFLTLTVLAFVSAFSVQVPAECPYSSSQGPIIAGFTLSSWEEYWNLFKANDLGMIVFETVTDDFLPAVLDLVEATGEVQNLPKTIHDVVMTMDWSLLKRSSFLGTLHRMEAGTPGVRATLRITPPESGMVQLFQNLSGLFEALAAHSQGVLVWTAGEEQGRLGLAVLEPAASTIPAEGRGLFFLHQLDSSVILTTDHLFSPDEPGRSPKSSIEELWKRLPEPLVSSIMMDLSELASLLKDIVKPVTSLVESTASEAASSLVLDKTKEALFEKDPETLEKLRQVERDFNQIMPSFKAESISKPLQNIVDLIKDQGVIVAGSSPVPGGISETMLWSFDSTGTNGGFFDVAPLSPVMLSLLRPGAVEVSLQGLPDYRRIYSFLFDLIQQFPGGAGLIGEWEKIQGTIGYSVEKDLLPAIGPEMGWITRESEKGGISGLQVINNDLFFVLSLGDASAARRTIGKIEETLAKYGFPATATQVADVTFSVLDAGLLGKSMWAELKQPPLFILTTSASTQPIVDFIEMIRNPLPQGLTQHSRWDQLQRIWTDQPTAVTLSNLTTTWKQTLDQLKSSLMMVALMGSSGSLSLPFIRMGIRILENMQPPEWLFTVNSSEPGLRISRTLLLYPPAEKEGTQP